jgi:hypothetical protein
MHYAADKRGFEERFLLGGETLHLHDDTIHLDEDTLHLHEDTINVHDDTLHLRGDTLNLHGETLHLHGETLHLYGDTLDVRGETLRARGEAIFRFEWAKRLFGSSMGGRGVPKSLGRLPHRGDGCAAVERLVSNDVRLDGVGLAG